MEVYSTSNSSEIYSKSALRDFLTVVALSLHAIFEGLAVGLEKDQHDVWILFAGTTKTIGVNCPKNNVILN